MSWFKISIPRSEASTKIAELVLDFHDTLQAADSQDGIALFRQKSVYGNEIEIYYISLNTPRPSDRFQEFYRAEKCPPPEPYSVELFGVMSRHLRQMSHSQICPAVEKRSGRIDF